MRRRKLLGLTGLMLPLQLSAATREPTPSQTEGPFYPTEAIPVISSLILDASGFADKTIQLYGQVLDVHGNPMSGAKIEIWQCDLNGLYQHPAQDNRERFDTKFAGFGAQLTDALGQYQFETLFPAPYPGRPPHIHVKIWQAREELLTTQLYLHGKTGGGWFASRREALQINPKRADDGLMKAQFTFVI